MQCANPVCAQPLEEGVNFCPYCRTKQPDVAVGEMQLDTLPVAPLPTPASLANAAGLQVSSTAQDKVQPVATTVVPPAAANRILDQASQIAVSDVVNSHKPAQPPAVQPVRPSYAPASNPVPSANPSLQPGNADLVMRASDNIWDFEEPEWNAVPGMRRALLIVDEQITHLAHTDQQFTPEQLLGRTREILGRQNVPVQLALLRGRWLNDLNERRPRLVATLTNRSDSDIRIVFGVDYLGKWASINFQVGIEPGPLPKTEPKQWVFPILAWVFGAAGLLGLFLPAELKVFGLATLVLAGIIAALDRKKFDEDQKRQAMAVYKDFERRLTERLFRTYKVDDARLFTAAMNEVYKAVVDDIVSRGAEVVRVTGGRGGFINNDEVASSVPARSADVVMADVA